MKPSIDELQAWYAKNERRIQQEYFEFLKIPSISTDPQYRKFVLQAADFVESYVKNLGFKTERWETSSYPVIFASHQVDPSRPTLLIYHHYDVQPTDPLELWKSPPFEPEVRDGNVYARGASDNKGQCFYTLTALRAFVELCKQIPCNIKLFIEGEEESGSRGAFEVLQKHEKALKADHLLIVDGGIPAKDVPGITLGLRGMMAVEVTCRNSTIDLHSGVHGGIALNPNRALVQMLSQLWDEKGKIKIPQFYDDVVVPSRQELEMIDQSLDQERLKRQFGMRAFQGEGGYSLWESNAIRPTLEINGITGGYTGVGFKTVIPAQAMAKISCRIVPNQEPEKVASQLGRYLQQIAPAGLEIKIQFEHGGKPVRCSPDSFIARISREAFSEVFGAPCLNILCGATVPLVADLAKASGGEVAVIGVSLDSDDIHAPNEHFSLHQLRQGFLVIGSILRRLTS
jgi:acetylornithine deacetylase/succinyl-diaminopimelate desuccinylase-like protein